MDVPKLKSTTVRMLRGRRTAQVSMTISEYIDHVWVEDAFETTDVYIGSEDDSAWCSDIYDWLYSASLFVPKLEGVLRSADSLQKLAAKVYHDFLPLKRAAVVKRSSALLITLAFVEWLVFQSRAGEPDRMAKLRLAHAGF